MGVVYWICEKGASFYDFGSFYTVFCSEESLVTIFYYENAYIKALQHGNFWLALPLVLSYFASNNNPLPERGIRDDP